MKIDNPGILLLFLERVTWLLCLLKKSSFNYLFNLDTKCPISLKRKTYASSLAQPILLATTDQRPPVHSCHWTFVPTIPSRWAFLSPYDNVKLNYNVAAKMFPSLLLLSRCSSSVLIVFTLNYHFDIYYIVCGSFKLFH